MAPQFSSKSPTIRRILREAAEMSSSPSGDYTAEPLESDLFEWHFTLRGPPNSAYSKGIYHGRIVLPPTYPLRPPSFRFMTPSGRFEANREICLSISGHHEETWQPAWGIRTAIVALRSFMETDARGQLGGLDTTDEVRRRLAQQAGSFKCPTCGRSNADIISESEKLASESSSSANPDVEVPSELSMGWKDEMAAKSQAAKGQAGEGVLSPADQKSSRDDDGEGAELAEGFVQTGPVNNHGSTDTRLLHSDTVASSPADTSRARLTAGGTGASGQPGQQQVLPRRPAVQQQRADGVPLWVDRAIVALVIALAALLLRVLFGA